MGAEGALAQQTRAFLYAALLGLSLGLFYYILRALRLVLGAGRLLTGALDLVFCFVSAAGFFAVTLAFCQGQIRSYGLTGAGLGAVLYFVGPSPFLLSLLAPAAQFIHSLPGRIQAFFKKGRSEGQESK